MLVHNIFQSIDGEVNCRGQGQIATFLRLAGCNLECSYCDTALARLKENSMTMTPTQIYEELERRKSHKITITGGEPMEQLEELEELVAVLHYRPKQTKGPSPFISIETNGSHKVHIDWPVCWVMDYKLKSSGMSEAMKLQNFKGLRDRDFIKFVISDRQDYEQAKHVIGRLKNKDFNCHARMAFGPVHKAISANELMNWLIEDGMTWAVINVQLHKYIDVE